MCGCFSHVPHWGPGPQPGMCPDQEWNQQPFGLQAGTQSTEPHQTEINQKFKITMTNMLRSLGEKADNMQKEIGNTSREMDIVVKNQKEISETKKH